MSTNGTSRHVTRDTRDEVEVNEWSAAQVPPTRTDLAPRLFEAAVEEARAFFEAEAKKDLGLRDGDFAHFLQEARAAVVQGARQAWNERDETVPPTAPRER
ncbi:MAG: hypothetical protein M3Q71_23045 [Chloroflexota bacterium]|nr:hypothetical protein [Chloroflexota bacterium]